jgi:hypothetical protein
MNAERISLDVSLYGGITRRSNDLLARRTLLATKHEDKKTGDALLTISEQDQEVLSRLAMKPGTWLTAIGVRVSVGGELMETELPTREFPHRADSPAVIVLPKRLLAVESYFAKKL